MSVTYRAIDNERVSKQWFVLLRDIRFEDNVHFNVNEGHRTMARQWYFWRLYKSGKGNLAAFPSPYAPHIRTGRIDHAIDFNNAAGVMWAMRKRGVRCALTVPGESWHVEANASDLQAYWNKHHFDPPHTIKRGSHGKLVRLLKRKLRAHHTPVARSLNIWHFGARVEEAVKRFQKRKRLKADGIVGYTTWKALLT